MARRSVCGPSRLCSLLQVDPVLCRTLTFIVFMGQSLIDSIQLRSSPFPSTNHHCCGRRAFLLSTAISFACTSGLPARTCAAETVGKDPNCNEISCLGVWDGILSNCPHPNSLFGAGCVSSQDDAPGIFAEPWDYSENPVNNSLNFENQMCLLQAAIERVCASRGDSCQVELQQDRYLRMSVVDGKTKENSIAEFYFTPNDTTVQFRIGSVVSGKSVDAVLRASSLKNMERSEMIRKELRYQKIPVLRNRKRSLLFLESDLDSFGPGSMSLGPPENMKSGEIDNGRFIDTLL